MKKIIMFMIALLWFIVPVFAEETTTTTSDYSSLYSNSGVAAAVDKMPDTAKQFLWELGVNPSDPSTLTKLNSENIFDKIMKLITEKAKAPIKAGFSLLAVILLCALAESMGTSVSKKELAGVYFYVSTLGAALVITIPLISVISSASSAVSASGVFMLTFVPVFAGILIASARAASGASFGTLTFGAAQVIEQIGSKILVPFIGLFLALSITGAVSVDIKLSGFTSIIKKVILSIITGATTIFLAILCLQTTISSAGDTVTAKTAKYFVGAFVPVIGSSLSDALSAVGGQIGLLKSTVGIFGIASVCIIILPSLIEVLLWQLSVSLCAYVAEMFNLENIRDMLWSVSSALTILISILILTMILFLISISVVLAAGGGI